MFVEVVKGNRVVLGGGGVLSRSGRGPQLGRGGAVDRQESAFLEEITFIKRGQKPHKNCSITPTLVFVELGIAKKRTITVCIFE